MTEEEDAAQDEEEELAVAAADATATSEPEGADDPATLAPVAVAADDVPVMETAANPWTTAASTAGRSII